MAPKIGSGLPLTLSAIAPRFFGLRLIEDNGADSAAPDGDFPGPTVVLCVQRGGAERQRSEGDDAHWHNFALRLPVTG